jgi:hypothetical protein
LKYNNLIIGIVVLSCFVLSFWLGWYATALGLGVIGTWFGIEIWKIAKLDRKIMTYLTLEVIFIWVSFSMAFYQLTSNIEDSLVVSMQNLLHFTFINTPSKLAESGIFRILACIEGFVGYLLIISGIALFIKEKK